MRWVSLETAGERRVGVLADDRIHVTGEARTLLALLERGDLAEAGERALADPEAVLAVDESDLLAPLPEPPSIRDFMAFEQHVDGVGRLVGALPLVPDVWYEQPLFYFSNPAAVVGPREDVPMPPGCSVLDYELEVAAVVGRSGADLTVEDADQAIAGYLVMNDWSARDLQFSEMRGPLGPAKGKDSAITLGPWFVTADELEPYRSRKGFDLGMSVWISDELMGEDRLDNLGWSFAEMVSYASRGTRVRPGDVVGSGTCGNGCLAELWGRHGREAHRPLAPGDVVRMTVEGLGTISNRVVAGGPVRAPLTQRKPAGPWK
ncbi:MAG: fumarylacetoacetate hydrolase [Amycolatopsis sp.]|nr:fumarylacetoacetate hydrolase [Amycolatopsis sp.]